MNPIDDEQPRPDETSSRRPTSHLVTRRSVITAGMVTLGAIASGAGLIAALDDDTPPDPASGPKHSTPPPSAGQLPHLQPLVAEPDRAAFDGWEQRCAPYLIALATIANEINDSRSPRRGFFEGDWWRTPSEPHNARTCELVYVLSWFAAAERPWNPYFRDHALSARLEAALGHYLSLQHTDGSWPEYDRAEHSPAATAFALGYLTKTLQNLRAADILPERRHAIVDSVRAGMRWFLSPANEDVWGGERINLSNQVLAAFSGASQALRHDPDQALQRMLDERISFAAARIQSPAGFLYEDQGMDLAYNLSVALPEIAELHENLGREPFIPHVRRLADWLNLALVPEPDGAGFIAFNTPSTRTDFAYLNAVSSDGDPRDRGAVLSGPVPLTQPFFTSSEDRKVQRQQWSSAQATISGIDRGKANPRVIADAPLPEELPSQLRKDAAIARMPTMSRPHFTDLRRVTGNHDYLFVKRPHYYVQAYLGRRQTNLAVTGLSLLWHPRGGTFIHAGPDVNTAWGAQIPGHQFEGFRDLAPRYLNGADELPLTRPAEVNGAEDLRVRWDLDDNGSTSTVHFDHGPIHRFLRVEVPILEQVPLLLMRHDILTWHGAPKSFSPSEFAENARSTGLTVARGTCLLRLDWAREMDATIEPVDRYYFADRSRRSFTLRVKVDSSVTFRYEVMDDRN